MLLSARGRIAPEIGEAEAQGPGRAQQRDRNIHTVPLVGGQRRKALVAEGGTVGIVGDVGDHRPPGAGRSDAAAQRAVAPQRNKGGAVGPKLRRKVRRRNLERRAVIEPMLNRRLGNLEQAAPMATQQRRIGLVVRCFAVGAHGLVAAPAH